MLLRAGASGVFHLDRAPARKRVSNASEEEPASKRQSLRQTETVTWLGKLVVATVPGHAFPTFKGHVSGEPLAIYGETVQHFLILAMLSISDLDLPS